jgi:hypothetical protein
LRHKNGFGLREVANEVQEGFIGKPSHVERPILVIMDRGIIWPHTRDEPRNSDDPRYGDGVAGPLSEKLMIESLADLF